MAKPLLVHIGYHKTATTWMQGRLFTSTHGYKKIADHADVFRHIVQPHGFRFDPAPMQALIAERLARTAPQEVPVISSEIISGHPFQGGRESDVYAERLHCIVPKAKILISIRNQFRIMPSVYMQYLMRGGTMPYDRFFKGQSEIEYFGFTPNHFQYDLLVAKYQSLFGAQNVYVLTQESIQINMDATVKNLAAFAENHTFSTLHPEAQSVYIPSYPEYAASVLRRINHVQTSVLNPAPVLNLGKTPGGLYRIAGYMLRHGPLMALLKSHKPVSDFVRQHFCGYFIDSNIRLAALVRHPLDLTGYEGV